MYPQDQQIIKEITLTRNLKEGTTKTYIQAINKYTQLHHQPLTELLKEAEKEEEQRIRWKHRTLRKRLLQYRNHLYQHHQQSTANLNYTRILTIYRHYEIEIQHLPPISKRNPKTVIQFKDLPDKEIIRNALQITTPLHKAVILFIATTGCSMIDTLNLRIPTLLKSVEDYYKTDDVYDMIHHLKNRTDVIPTFEITRKKTGKHHYTFCTTETFQNICLYLLTRKALNNHERVFRVNNQHLMLLFRTVNDNLGLGEIGDSNFVRFRSHMLRKFHASALYNDGVSMDLVNELQGKSKNKVDTSYFMEDPMHLKKVYMEHMDALTFNQQSSNDEMVGSMDYDMLINRITELEGVVNKYMSSDDFDCMDKYL